MENLAPIDLVAVTVASFLAAAFAMFVASRFFGFQARSTPIPEVGDDPRTLVFLFEETTLVDTSEAAQDWLDRNCVPAEEEYDRVLAHISYLCPDLKPAESLAATSSAVSVVSTIGDPSVRLSRAGSAVRIEFGDQSYDNPARLDNRSVVALEAEVETLRENTENLPYLVWRETGSGEITWINRAYLDFVETSFGTEAARRWPPLNVFETKGFLSGGKDEENARLPARQGEGDLLWFDCHSKRVTNEILFCATDAAPTVRAETQLREFTQTLAKTFSHLTVGLAIFDKNRRLRLFNPALADLTALSPEFLTQRPTLFGFLDELREGQMIPEPKDYSIWRAQLTAMEQAASSGTYQETWSLPSGQTYRVAGRPHPDGSIAFLFEDISSEISLTRRFRAELELGQAVVDAIPDAVAVFSRSGTLTLTNLGFAQLWGSEPNAKLDPPNINDLTELWVNSSTPSPVWGDFREFCLSPGGRAEWGADVALRDGRMLACRFSPLPGGSTLAAFSQLVPPSSVPSARSHCETA